MERIDNFPVEAFSFDGFRGDTKYADAWKRLWWSYIGPHSYGGAVDIIRLIRSAKENVPETEAEAATYKYFIETTGRADVPELENEVRYFFDHASREPKIVCSNMTETFPYMLTALFAIHELTSQNTSEEIVSE